MTVAKTKRNAPARRKDKKAGDFAAVFAGLKKILEPYEERLSVLPYRPEFYCLQTRGAGPNGKPVWFAAVRMGKNYVSYHFMPIYMNPGLQKRISPELKKRMQGKACFNFNAVDSQLFRELEDLTAAGFEGYRAKKFA